MLFFSDYDEHFNEQKLSHGDIGNIIYENRNIFNNHKNDIDMLGKLKNKINKDRKKLLNNDVPYTYHQGYDILLLNILNKIDQQILDLQYVQEF